MAAPFKVIIAGGGLAGSLLANGLVNHGVNVTVYERDAEDAKREGFQIRLGDSAMTGFNACLKPADIAAIKSQFSQMSSTGLTAPTLMNTRFQTVLDLGKLPSYSASSAINRVVLRDILVAPLQERGIIRFGKAFEGYEVFQSNDGQENVRVHFADGTTDTCDILVGADGSGSRINKQVGARNIVSIDSHAMILSKGPLPEDWTEKLPERLTESPLMVFAGGVSMFYALFLPAADEATQKAGNGARYNTRDASYYWGVLIPKEKMPTDDWNKVEDPLGICLDATRDWAPEYRTMLTTGFDGKSRDLVTVARMRASNRLAKTWRNNVNRATGDEGHPRATRCTDTTCHARGMGGNQAFHDCADALSHILALKGKADSGVQPSTQDISVACSQYERRVIDRAFQWVRKSGGTSVPMINLDGWLGSLVWMLGSLLVSAYIFMARVLKSGARQ
ncbi:hypothetical protein HER10_EVM0001013 [Colletotrichum scovillei]|uniref:uncharacterized protein n=1 Tax=Colletotrichum scovillei TaxID=1209932 RepID=UPI0015C3817E|nr:uncharacterized protein HER10_EVM0001013 [Colletotrichum scovillei]KAF4773035.1 hypothetical protein HER10_EVM0001013 [Colletotrichum scovillei]